MSFFLAQKRLIHVAVSEISLVGEMSESGCRQASGMCVRGGKVF